MSSLTNPGRRLLARGIRALEGCEYKNPSGCGTCELVTLSIMSSVPSQMQAVIVQGKSKAEVQKVDTPQPGPGEILVKVSHVALNPTDWKHLDFFGVQGSTLGSDFVGTVTAKGQGADDVQQGDRVAGCVHGGWTKGVGAFAEYLVTNAKAVVVVPSWIDDEHAPNLGVGGVSAFFGLFQPKHLGLPEPALPLKSLPPVDQKRKVLVWSGATSVGQYAVQYARASGAYVITTGSPKNNDFLKSLGASEVFDYHDEQTPEKIASAHPDLSYAFDTYSENGSQEACARALSKEQPSKLVAILPLSPDLGKLNPKVKATFLILYTVSGEETDMFGSKFSKEYCQEDLRYLIKVLSGKEGDYYKLFESGLVKPNRTSLLSGGLDHVLEGLDRLRKGQVSGEKLTYKIA